MTLLADGAADRPAVLLRHRDVQQHQVEGRARQRFQAGRAAVGLHDVEAQRREHGFQQLPLRRLVVHHQDALAAAEIAGHLAQRLLALAGPAHLGQVDLQAKDAALTGLAGHAELAAHDVGEHVADGQSQPGAGFLALAGGIGALEGQEDALDVFRGNAHPGVLDLELGDFAGIRKAQRDRAAVGELDRIAQQVDQDLAQPLLIRVHQFRDAAEVDKTKGQPLLRRLRPEHAHDLVEELAQRQLVRIEPHLAGLDACDVEQAVDQAQQVFAAAPDHADGVAAVFRHGGVGLQYLRITQDAVERRAQFMAHAGHIAALGQVGRLGSFLGPLQLDVGALVRLDFLQQQIGLPLRLLQRHAAALAGQHQPPHADAGQQQQR